MGPQKGSASAASTSPRLAFFIVTRALLSAASRGFPLGWRGAQGQVRPSSFGAEEPPGACAAEPLGPHRDRGCPDSAQEAMLLSQRLVGCGQEASGPEARAQGGCARNTDPEACPTPEPGIARGWSGQRASVPGWGRGDRELGVLGAASARCPQTPRALLRRPWGPAQVGGPCRCVTTQP